MAVDPSSPRYRRQRALAGFGAAAQARLAAAHVVVIGAGGLGSAVLPALAAAGVGRITIVDDDDVDVTNLHRQTVHGAADVGRAKVDSAAATLAVLSPDTVVDVRRERFDARNAGPLLAGVDVLVDGGDTAATRYLADDAATAAGIPLVWGSALGWSGQVGVASDAAGIGYRDLYPDEDAADDLSCEIIGVLPTICTVIGGLMATETLKLLTGAGDPLIGRAQMYDARTGSLREVTYRRAAAVRRPERTASRPEDDDVRPADLDAVLAGDGALLLDVREPGEAVASPLLDALLIPLGDLRERMPELDTGRPIVVTCQRGVRSRRAVRMLREAGFTARGLAGGVDALHRERATR